MQLLEPVIDYLVKHVASGADPENKRLSFRVMKFFYI